MKGQPPEFPKRVVIELTEFQRDGLGQIADRLPHEGDSELLKIVVSRGILAVLSGELNGAHPSPKQVARNMNAAKSRVRELVNPDLTTQAGLSPWPAPSVRYQRKRRRLEALPDLENDMALANGPEDEEEFDAAPGRQVERYVATPISEDLRLRLDKFLADHPELDEERCIAALLGLGLDRAELALPPDGPKTKRAGEMLRLAEALYRRARARCRG